MITQFSVCFSDKILVIHLFALQCIANGEAIIFGNILTYYDFSIHVASYLGMGGRSFPAQGLETQNRLNRSFHYFVVVNVTRLDWSKPLLFT